MTELYAAERTPGVRSGFRRGAYLGRIAFCPTHGLEARWPHRPEGT